MKLFAFLGLLLLLGLSAFAKAGFRINSSGSIPPGLYRLDKSDFGLGDYVLFCPPNTRLFQMAKKRGYIDTGFCEHGYQALMKKVLALPGDTVAIRAEGVFINGRLQPNSEALQEDGAKRVLSIFAKDYQLKQNEVFLLGDSSPYSFDSRYFGPITTDRLHTLKPIYTKPIFS